MFETVFLKNALPFLNRHFIPMTVSSVFTTGFPNLGHFELSRGEQNLEVGNSDIFLLRTGTKVNKQNTNQKTPIAQDLQDGGGVKRGDHLPPNKYIRNTSEHLLNTGRRPQTSQNARNSPCTLGRAKEKKKQKQKNRDGTYTSRREL